MSNYKNARINVNFTQGVKERVYKEAAKADVPASHIVRQAVQLYLDSKPNQR